MKKKLIGLLVVVFSSASVCACDKPEAPEIPDPSTAVTAQMVKAQNDVKAYVQQTEEYIKCERRSRARDDAAAELERVASEFNKSIKAYKERMGS